MRMSTGLVLGCLAGFASGCGGGGGSDAAVKGDMALVKVDMATTLPDLTMSGDMPSPPDMTLVPDLAMETVAMTVNVGPGGGRTFDPKNVTVKVGDTVKWVWMSSNHNVVSGTAAADDKFCSPMDMNCATAPLSIAGATYSHKFTAAGTFPYFCKPHLAAGMTGSVTVQ